MNVKDVVFTGGSHVVIWGTGASIACTLLNPEKKSIKNRLILKKKEHRHG